MSDDDDDLLSLNLDDDAIQTAFKKPPVPVTENFLLDKNNDEIVSTLAAKSNSATSAGDVNSETALMRQLFANDDEDEEDQFIASQTIFVSSTQFKSQPTVPAQKKQSPAKAKTPQKIATPRAEQNENVNKENLEITTIARTTPAVKTRSNELAMLETLANHKSWTFAQMDIKNMLQSTEIDASFVHTYTLSNYFKKFFEYDLLMRSDDIGIRKLPMLCVWVKEITRKPTSATVALTDFTENIKGTIMNTFLKTKSNWDYLMVGSVLLIKDVCLLKVNNNKNCYHLNINLNNIVSIYYPDLESESVAATKKFSFQPFDAPKLKELIDEFENLYTKYEYKPPVAAANDSIFNKTNSSRINKSVNKPAPYRIPPHLNKNQVNKTNPTRPDKPNQTTVSKANSSTLSSSRISEVDSTLLRQQVISSIVQDNGEDDDDLLFFAENHSSTQKTQPSTALSEEIFSQLIFGCDDQLFNDD